MSQDTVESLPTELADGLILRWATEEDTDAIAEFNSVIHSDIPNEPEPWLGDWTRDLMNGKHPTTAAGDFTVVVDPSERDKLVSTACLISQEWTYDGIPFRVGRPELIATDPGYRRRGLVRHQMAVLHARSAQRGELVNAITGIPWYYRQFGYDMALNEGGSRQFYWQKAGKSLKVEEETLRWRPAEAADIPALNAIYEATTRRGPIARPRDERQWHYELFEMSQDSIWRLKAHVVEDAEGTIVGYVDVHPWGNRFHVAEAGVHNGRSWREIGLFLLRQCQRRAEELNKDGETSIGFASLHLGEDHPLYEALEPELEQQKRPWAFYVRVPDLKAFLRHIAPALDNRLAGSIMAGYSGTLKVNLFQQWIQLTWEQGKLSDISDYEPTAVDDGDVVFPNLTFLQLVFGHRNIDELRQSYADCYARSGDAAVLLRILFPRRPSFVIPLP